MKKAIIPLFFICMLFLCFVSVHVGVGLRISDAVSVTDYKKFDITKAELERAQMTMNPDFDYWRQVNYVKTINSNGFWYTTDVDTTGTTYHWQENK